MAISLGIYPIFRQTHMLNGSCTHGPGSLHGQASGCSESTKLGRRESRGAYLGLPRRRGRRRVAKVGGPRKGLDRYIMVYLYCNLVGGIPNPLKNVKVSLGLLFPIYGKIRKMLQSTHQVMLRSLIYSHMYLHIYIYLLIYIPICPSSKNGDYRKYTEHLPLGWSNCCPVIHLVMGKKKTDVYRLVNVYRKLWNTYEPITIL